MPYFTAMTPGVEGDITALMIQDNTSRLWNSLNIEYSPHGAERQAHSLVRSFAARQLASPSFVANRFLGHFVLRTGNLNNKGVYK